MYENPSAGKFDAPPAPEDPTAPRPPSKRWWFRLLLIVSAAYPILLFFLRDHTAWLRGLLVLLAIPALLLELVLNRINARDRGHENPYTEPTQLTR